MKAGAALADWLADPARQLQSLDAINAFADEAAQRPLMADLKRALVATPVKTQANLRPLVEHFLSREAELQALFDDTLAATAADPFFRPPFARISSEITSGLLIFEDPALFIALSVIDVHKLAAKKVNATGGSSLNFTGVPTLYKFLKGGGTTLSIWEIPEIEPGFAMDRGDQCRMIERRILKDGETLMIDGRYQSFVIEHAKSDIVYIYAAIRAEESPVALEYDSRTLKCVGASSTDEASSRIQMMITLLRLMDRQDAAPLFAEMLNSPHFYTRWHVMREYLALDAEGALPHLKRMADRDIHPEVRAAARQTLDAFFPAEEYA
jgi:hypothetical protein